MAYIPTVDALDKISRFSYHDMSILGLTIREQRERSWFIPMAGDMLSKVR